MSPLRQRITADQKGIGAVLAANRLAVPPNQRDYEWASEHVEDLFTDLANAIVSSHRTYFLGTIVLTSPEGAVPEVSDGQQRLATVTILIAAIRDYFARIEDKRAESITSTYLSTMDLETTDLVPRLRLNINDNEFFAQRILANPDSPDRAITPTKNSHRLIAQAADLAEKHVTSIVEPYKEADRKTRLVEWVTFIRERAEVIVLGVPDHLDAFVMFETLNDRGLRASQADLVKNHLFRLAQSRVAAAQGKWSAMESVLESLEQEDLTVAFLHVLLVGKSGPIKERDVLDEVRRHVDSEGQALAFLTEAAEAVSDYAALFNPEHVKWNSYGVGSANIRRHLVTINRDLRAKQIRPLLFAVARSFSPAEASAAFRLFVCWSVRFLIVGTGGGGVLDRAYALQAQAVAQGRITTAAELAAAIKDVVPGDGLFEARFSEARVAQSYLARYYLRALETQNQGMPDPELMPNEDPSVINLEHILPENPDPAAWPQVTQDVAEANWRRIGNMVLLQARRNSLVGNSSFADKRPVLEASTFALTRDAGAEASWGADEIERRQKKLAAIAVKTWGLKS